MSDKNVYDVSKSDISINENTKANSFSNEATTIQGPMGDNNEIQLQKARTMEMLTNDCDILTARIIQIEISREDCKKFLYVMATHSIT